MEDLKQIRMLHEKVQSDIFRILIQYNIIHQVSSTAGSKLPMYYLSEDYKFLFYEIPSEVSAFFSSINRLLETRFIQIVLDPFSEQSFFIKSRDIEAFQKEEKDHFIVLPEKTLNAYLEKRSRVSFLDGIL